MATIRHEILDFPEENPFENCILDREKYADNLTEIIKNYSEGFVLSVNNKWGEGKTTFVKMWHQKLLKEKFETVFFNAWENDINQDALIAILGEIAKKVNSKTDEVLKNVLIKGSRIFTKTLPLIAKKIGTRVVGKEGIEDLIEIAFETISGSFEKNVENYKKQQEGIDHFKTALKDFAIKKGNGKPLLIFIDELDRCKPDYAIDVLEKIKHFFNVPNIVFVLSIDKSQLANAVRGYYGSDKIDGDEYLRKFIDFEFSLPVNSNHEYIDFLYERLNFDAFFGQGRQEYLVFANDKRYFLEFSKIFSENLNLTPRELLQLFGKIRMVLFAFKTDELVFPTVVFFLVYLKIYMHDEYQLIRDKRFNLKEIINLNKELILKPKLARRMDVKDILCVHEYVLFTTYSNYTEQTVEEDHFIIQKDSFIVDYKDISVNPHRLHEILSKNGYECSAKKIGLEYLMNKIELNSTLNFNLSIG